SGVGKTSLLNAIQPGLGLRVRELSESTGKGRHTTTHLELIELDDGGMVADTPGLREVGIWGRSQGEIAWLFREMRPFLGTCRFARCSHLSEPGCGIREVVASGAVTQMRYESYMRLYEEASTTVS
ncbi:MAG: ribosome small subunit-dependent GTPase A, partial [Candidatus Latescibacteria bacterium]|nr:ribosome small subunit-dependent GTPase A [Candidatus Latescibacterota bacterium]